MIIIKMNDLDDSVEQNDEENFEQIHNVWGINFIEEKNFQDNYLLDKCLYAPKSCPCCKRATFKILENTKRDILNPYIIRCSYYKCTKNQNLRHYSFFYLHKNIPASIIVYVFYLFIIVKLNAKQIGQSNETKYNTTLSNNTICNILKNIRSCIADYFKQTYREKQIGGEPSLERTVASTKLYIYMMIQVNKSGLLEGQIPRQKNYAWI